MLAAERIMVDRTAEGKDERKAKVHITVGNLISADTERLDEALAYMDKGISIYPVLPNAYNSRGSVLHKMGRKLDAKAAFEDAIERNPNYANAHFNLGLVLYQIGDSVAAVREFQTTLRIDPVHTMARLQLQNMQGSGDFKTASNGKKVGSKFKR